MPKQPTPKQPTDRMEKEATAKKVSKYATVQWEGADILIKPARKWPLSAIAAIETGDIKGIQLWAEKVLSPESFDKWNEIDPDLDQFTDLSSRAMEVLGESLPESSASPDS